MPRIAAICAVVPFLNTGMLTVDLALNSYLSRRFPDKEIRLDHFNIEGNMVISGPSHPVALRYDPVPDIETLSGYDAILFWGDFLQSNSYHAVDVMNRVRKRNPGMDDEGHRGLHRRYTDLLLLRDAPVEVLNKVICFGNSLLINRNTGEDIADYNSAVSRLYENAQRVLLRDPISAHFAQVYAHREDTTLGLDSAFLLRPSDEFSWRRRDPARADDGAKRKLGISFGRGPSKSEDTARAMNRFAEEVAKRIGCSGVVDIGWLVSNRADPFAGVSDKLSTINECAAVITDTYHCAVNSWREGVPALCIGTGAEAKSGTLSDKKKEILFSMFNAREFYIFVENLRDESALNKVAAQYAATLRNQERVAAVTEAIARATERAEGRLTASLEKLI